MRLAVVTPVGPGHQIPSRQCWQSVCNAWTRNPGPFAIATHRMKDDGEGKLGRSRARNLVVEENSDADWFFFIDADDLCFPNAFEYFGDALANECNLIAVFGAIAIEQLPPPGCKIAPAQIIPENVWPLDWDGLMRNGATGTLSMGCFVRGDIARATPFNESMDAGEDFEFYLRALECRSWRKLAEPLVAIRRHVPSATGPRGYVILDWREECEKVIEDWKRCPTPR